MNNEFIIGIAIVAAVVAAIIIAAKVPKLHHAFLVPEGYAGLLYHKSKFVEVLGPGRHIRWGRHFTLGPQDLANAARVLEGNPALMNLRLLQSLTAAQNTGNTLVLGIPGGFVPLNQAKPGREAGEVKENGGAEG